MHVIAVLIKALVSMAIMQLVTARTGRTGINLDLIPKPVKLTRRPMTALAESPIPGLLAAVR